MSVNAVRAGFFTTVQDLGRSGFRKFGVSLGGALDSHALRVANLLAGNDESAAGLETAFGGLRLRFSEERIVAWCGGDFEVQIGSRSLPGGHAILVNRGDELSIAFPKLGCHVWLAISGGIDVPEVLGSRSVDLRSGFGGINSRPLRDGEPLPLGKNPDRAKVLIEKLRVRKIADWKPPHDWTSTALPAPILRFTAGLNWDRFDPSTRQRFANDEFVVTTDSDRMGVRLDGPNVRRTDNGDLLSEAVAPGTIQVPPNGKPILLLNDCQTVGGYPKIGHVITVDLARAAQLRAGDKVRFREVSLATAHQLLSERELNLAQFRRGLEAHFR